MSPRKEYGKFRIWTAGTSFSPVGFAFVKNALKSVGSAIRIYHIIRRIDMGDKRIEMVGRKFWKLTVVSYAFTRGSVAWWNCLCDCGKIKPFSGNDLRCGGRKSCGCSSSKHGMIRGNKASQEYYVWRGVKKRIFCVTDIQYPNYGGRGLDMDPAWINDFGQFMADMGPRPEGMSIERRDNNRGYWPDNCYWATPKEQQNNHRGNHRVNYNGKSYTIAQLSELCGKPYYILWMRIVRSRWSVDDAVTKPRGYRKPRFVHDWMI